MTTIEAPVRQQTIQIEENENQRIIGRMIELVKGGRWCRDTTCDKQYRSCTLGLINRLIGYHRYKTFVNVIEILNSAIPAGALDGERGEAFATVNGGTSRGRVSATSRVCSYNNTVGDESEIIEWYEAARLNA